MSDLLAHAKRELRQLPGARSYERKMLEADILALVAVFQSQKHSGGSARFVTDCLNRLLRWQSLTGAGDKAEAAKQ